MTIKREPRIYDVPDKFKRAKAAGRVDLLAECSGNWMEVYLDGEYIIDWKSSKEPQEPTGYPEWPLQVNPYRKGTVQTGVGNPTGSCVVRLDKETGIPTIYDYSDRYEERCEAFFHLLNVYRELHPRDFDKGVPSVTTVLGILNKPGLVYWAANCSRDWVIQQAHKFLKQYELPPGGPQFTLGQVEDWANEAPKNFRKVSGKATDIGKEVHRLIELDLKGKQLPKMNHVLPAVENGFSAYLSFKEAVNLKPIAIEYKVYITG